jgi:hypothetical protein
LGKLLEHCTYRHPLKNDRPPETIIGGDYITTEAEPDWFTQRPVTDKKIISSAKKIISHPRTCG